MLTPQEARERLQAFHDPNHRRNRLDRLSRLSGDISFVGQILIQAGPEWEKVSKNWGRSARALQEIYTQFGKWKDKDRRKLFEAILPGVPEQVESTWGLFDRLPYQAGYYRRPFRMPDHPSPAARVAWLQKLVYVTQGYEGQDAVWFAAWAAHLGYGAPDALGYLFAGAIEQGDKIGQEVYDILIASASGTHAIGGMGRHVTRGLLCASRREGWEFIERMLLAAQREEGLRQVILESIDEAHPQAFRRMLGVVLEHNLGRFSAAVRAFNVWFGLALENVPPKTVNEILGQVLKYLDSPADREGAIRDGLPQEAYYALWAQAFDDAQAALPQAAAMSRSTEPERRFAAAHLLGQLDLKESYHELLIMLADDDLRVAACAVLGLARPEYNRELLETSDLFERLENLIARLPHKQNSFKSPVWEWLTLSLNREDLAGRLIGCLGKRSPKRLVPYVSMMEPTNRGHVAQLITELGKKDAETRQVLLTLAGDPSSYAREKALEALQGFELDESETIQVESLLARRAQDLRRGVIQLILGLKDEAVLRSAARLLGQKSENQRVGGLEILRECKQAGRKPVEVRALAAGHSTRESLGDGEQRMLDEILQEATETYTLDDALGLMDPQGRTRPEPPHPSGLLGGRSGKGMLATASATACLRSLDELVAAHRNEPVEVGLVEMTRTELLGNLQYGFPQPDPHLPLDQAFPQLPLYTVWESWYQSRPQQLRDPDGLELLRAMVLARLFNSGWHGTGRSIAQVPVELQRHFDLRLDFSLNYQPIIQGVLAWLVRAHPAEGETDLLLDALEDSVGRIPLGELTGVVERYGTRDRTLPHAKLVCLQVTREQRAFKPKAWTDRHHARLWRILRWLDEPAPGIPRYYPQLDDALYAYKAGAATRDDLLDLFLGRREVQRYGGNFPLLMEFSGRKPHLRFERFPILKELIDACRERILAIETRRGDLPTAASAPAAALRSVPGLSNLMRLLAALGKTGFERGYSFGLSRSAILSHLIRNSYPVEGDSPEEFARQAGANRIGERRLIELAVYAPQWVEGVQFALGWPKLDEAVWWVYAHTKDRQWTVEPGIRDEWAARISEHTPLSADSLMDGAVDVAWFNQVYSDLGEERWGEVYRAAEYAAGGAGHNRARLFADAMLGRLTAEACTERLMKKRHQDSARALGLIPLPTCHSEPQRGEESRTSKHKAGQRGDSSLPPVAQNDATKEEILRRYEVLQEFLRTGRKFGSMRQASEKLAVAIGMENLARTAGYADPQRLEWAMETEAVGDLARGPISLEKDGISLSLAINDLGEPELTVSKKGKPLKTIPAAVKKDGQVADLLSRKQKLERQVGRMRRSLEEAMCRGESFTAAELAGLFRHPMLRTLVEQLIFVGPNGMGYPVEAGRALLNHDGVQIPVGEGDELRVAHPLDLLGAAEWHCWQHECFIAERIQPFKQVFRELYVLTAAERSEGKLSRRYAGQQVNPRQAVALFGTRGWVVDPNEGVKKTFHEAGLSVHVGFLQGAFTPAEIESPTLEGVVFTRRGEWKPVNLEKVPDRIFSEVMRDLDLVVSVAHAGGIDPEASASSIEARTALIRETCTLLKMSNVTLAQSHVLVEGKLSSYNVHLGSGVVHKQPGGALCIIPVHSQHRGRLFLPFVEDDAKTAEILSKVILLARDDQIKDPTILEQILN
jgi:HEAT repeat protein